MKKNNVDDFFKELEKDNKKIRKWRKWYKKEKEIINFLSNLRSEKGISQQELADYTGIKQPAIARLENRINSPQLSTLIKYVDALGLEIEFYSKDDIKWKELKREIIDNVKEYEMISNIEVESIVEQHGEIWLYKGLFGLGHKLEVLHNPNTGKYIPSNEYVGIVYEGEEK